jgi:hypothetical protein
MKWKDLTPEQQASVDRIAEEWINRHLEFKTAEDGTPLFRMKRTKDKPRDKDDIHPGD